MIATPDILVPSTPRHLKITQTMFEDFIINPVLGARVIFNEIMDEFQKVRLKQYWWIPRVIDSSGLGSFKTRTFFIAWNLRAVLMSDRVLGVYYQNFQSGKDKFWSMYDLFNGNRAPIFRAQIGRIDVDDEAKVRRGERREPSCWKVQFKNSSMIMMPAPDFIRGGDSQAGLNLNDLGIDEYTKIDATGKTGIDDQLIGRCRRAVFNQDHPLWRNHHLFLATAEDTMHQAYDRYSDYVRQVKLGNPDYACLSYNFKDMSDRPMFGGSTFKRKLRESHMIKDIKMRLTKQKFLQEGLGIWAANGETYYSGETLERCVQLGRIRKVVPILGRIEDEMDSDHVRYFMGVDPAHAEGKKSADGAMVVLRAEPTVAEPSDRLLDWKLSVVWAYKVLRADVDQWSGLIHLKEKHFRFTGICMDHGGGGAWIKDKLASKKQRILDVDVDVTPICLPDDVSVSSAANYSLIMFHHGDPSIRAKWDFIKGADNVIDIGHTELKEAMEGGHIAFPKPRREWSKAEFESWPIEKQWSIRLLDLTRQQLGSIAFLTDNEGKAIRTRNNAQQFSARGKKDFAYALIHAYVRFLVWLKHSDAEFLAAAEDADGCS